MLSITNLTLIRDYYTIHHAKVRAGVGGGIVALDYGFTDIDGKQPRPATVAEA